MKNWWFIFSSLCIDLFYDEVFLSWNFGASGSEIKNSKIHILDFTSFWIISVKVLRPQKQKLSKLVCLMIP